MQPTTEKTEGRREIVQEGVKLKLIATKQWEGDWELVVLNEYGIRSVWFELFDTCADALNAGEPAIDTEGTGAFTDIEGFEYLFDPGLDPLPDLNRIKKN